MINKHAPYDIVLSGVTYHPDVSFNNERYTISDRTLGFDLSVDFYIAEKMTLEHRKTFGISDDEAFTLFLQRMVKNLLDTSPDIRSRHTTILRKRKLEKIKNRL